MAIKILIIEDEPATARNLEYMLRAIESEITTLAVLSSVSESIDWLREKATECDLIFMDIRLSDGMSFEIFDKINFKTPVVFVTAYNEFALQAFKSNGIDYILKPFDKSELEKAVLKFKNLKNNTSDDYQNQLLKLIATYKKEPSSYKQFFLVHYKEKLLPIEVSSIAWFYTENELVYATTKDQKQYIIDQTMEQLQQQLNPTLFFRANRQYIVQRKSILEVEFYFNARLSLKVSPEPKEHILISKARVTEFKDWMNS